MKKRYVGVSLDSYEFQTLKMLARCFGGNTSAAIRYALKNIAPPTPEQFENYLFCTNQQWGEAVKSMREMREAGMTYADIAKALNDSGTKNKCGNTINTTIVYRTIKKIRKEKNEN